MPGEAISRLQRMNLVMVRKDKITRIIVVKNSLSIWDNIPVNNKI
jgi:hypothetical protein